jgi:hypothetical protein
MAASARGRQRTDSTHVLAKVRALNRTECVVETLRHALNVLAVAAPEWGLRQVQPEWLERYGSRASEYRFPSGTDKRQQFEHQVGQDGWGLLAAIQADPPSVTGCSPSQPSIHCSEYGSKTTCLSKTVEPGLLTRIG